ncbi:MAG: hypothetical protein SWH68_16725 [Thermodesulfobacteriota bacterium]|nr:hypothetical protein [Thermodesulfobacteriota bacterium]
MTFDATKNTGQKTSKAGIFVFSASLRDAGLYPIAMLTAGDAVQAATKGLTEPSFGLIRPPGHHTPADASWGLCYFNNMAVAHRNKGGCFATLEGGYNHDVFCQNALALIEGMAGA